MNKIPFIVIACLSFLSCLPSRLAAREKLPPEDLETVEKRWPEAKVTFTGLRYVVVKEGSGDLPKSGALVSATYKGMLLNGKIFDQSLDPEKPFKFRIGRDMMIEGFDEGVSRMKKGEERILIIPFELGYGSRGKVPEIPAKSTLVFDITILDFENPGKAK